MAAIQTIRKRGVLLVSIIAVALFLFVAGDLFRGLESIFRNDAQQVGKVNGESLSIQDYQKMNEDFQNLYEIMQQKSSLSEEEMNSVKDEAWQTYVQARLIEKECNALGIAATDDEIKEIIRTGQSQLLQIPYFMNQQTGQYDYATVQAFLTNYQQIKEQGNAQMPDLYEKLYKYYMFVQRQLRDQIISNKYQVLLSNVFISNPAEAKLAFDSRASEADILLASFPASTVKDDAVSVTDDEVKARYNEDKVKYEQYVESRDLKIVDVLVVPSDEDKKAAEQEVAENAAKLDEASTAAAIANIVRNAKSKILYSDIYRQKDAYPSIIAEQLDSIAVGTTTKTTYSALADVYYAIKLVGKATMPDSVLYRQLGVIGKDDADIAKKADSIMTALSTGAKFKDIAKKYNQQGDSTWLTSAQFERSAIDASEAKIINTLYGMSAGETKKMKLDNGGVVIFQVLKTANPVTKYNVASIVNEVVYSEQTKQATYNKFSSFIAENQTVADLEANAQNAGYTVRPIDDITTATHSIANIRGTNNIVKWAFDQAKENEISQLYECGNNGDHLLVAAMTGVNKKGYRSLDKMKEQITEELKREKKIEQLMKSAEGVKSMADAKKLNAVIDTVKHVSFANPTFVAATTASEPLVGATATKTAVNAVSAPIKGTAGVYVLQVLNKNATQEKFDAKAEENAVAMNNFRAAVNMVINALYRRANVVDNRYRFF